MKNKYLFCTYKKYTSTMYPKIDVVGQMCLSLIRLLTNSQHRFTVCSFLFTDSTLSKFSLHTCPTIYSQILTKTQITYFLSLFYKITKEILKWRNITDVTFRFADGVQLEFFLFTRCSKWIRKKCLHDNLRDSQHFTHNFTTCVCCKTCEERVIIWIL